MSDSMLTDDLGRDIAACRKEFGVTQEELAALAGVSTRFLSSLKRGI